MTSHRRRWRRAYSALAQCLRGWDDMDDEGRDLATQALHAVLVIGARTAGDVPPELAQVRRMLDSAPKYRTAMAQTLVHL